MEKGWLRQLWPAATEAVTGMAGGDALGEVVRASDALTLGEMVCATDAVGEGERETERATDGETLGEAAALGVWVAEMVTLRDSADVLALGDGDGDSEAVGEGEREALAVTEPDAATLAERVNDGETLDEAASEGDGSAEGETDGETLAEAVGDGETVGVAETEKTWRSATNDTQSQPTLFAPMYTSIVPPAGRLVTVLVKVSGFEASQPTLVAPAAGAGKA